VSGERSKECLKYNTCIYYTSLKSNGGYTYLTVLAENAALIYHLQVQAYPANVGSSPRESLIARVLMIWLFRHRQ